MTTWQWTPKTQGTQVCLRPLCSFAVYWKRKIEPLLNPVTHLKDRMSRLARIFCKVKVLSQAAEYYPKYGS